LIAGRFQDEFVEARRAALERMLNKIAQHPLLQRDVDFKLFIESDAFNVDVKQREKANSINESKGFMGSIGLSGPFSGKMPESDEVIIQHQVVTNNQWFEDRRAYVDALESQFKAWSKAIDTIVKQQKGRVFVESSNFCRSS
jgi:sorting nexin-1/2